MLYMTWTRGSLKDRDEDGLARAMYVDLPQGYGVLGCSPFLLLSILKTASAWWLMFFATFMSHFGSSRSPFIATTLGVFIEKGERTGLATVQTDLRRE